jgi:outer membrane protein assembly factor BamB
VPGTGGTFFVLSSDTGDVLWSENISSNKQLPKIFHSGDIIANPIYHEGIIYIVSQSGFTAAFDINSSEELWNIPVGGLDTPTLSGNTIFVNGNMGLLAAIDITSGKLRWKKKYSSYINENSLFFDKEIAIYKGPTLVNYKILLSNLDGLINILDANNGKEISNLKIDKLALPPIPADKKIFFLTASGKLLAYK